MQESTDYYDYAATFWAKAAKPILGALVSNLTDEMRKALGTNKGVVVQVIAKSSPAFVADILRGDILFMFDGQEIIDAAQFFELVQRAQGKTVTINGLRDGRQTTYTAALMACSAQ